MKTTPETFLTAIAPYRAGLVVAVAWLFTWYGLADRCADEGIPCVLGQALSMQALHGGKAKNDKIDSQKIAAVLRGGTLPQAYVYPAQRRAPRDVGRRRRPLAHKRAERLAHVPNTNSHYNLPASGKKIAYKANREGVAERFADPAGPKSIAVDLALIPYYDELLRDLALPRVNTAKPHNANTLYRRQTVPGIGTILRLVLLYAIHDITRFPSVQDFVSSCRLVKCAKASGGQRLGTSGAKIGKAHLTWAFSEAAVLCLRDNPAAQKYLARLEKTHDKGTALTLLAQKLARAVYYMLHRQVACERETFFQSSGRRAEAPAASLDTKGWPLKEALTPASCTAALTAQAPIGHETLRPALGLDIRSRSCLTRRSSRTAYVGCSSPEPGATWTTLTR
jgi:transposase